LAPGVLDALKIVRPETVIRWHPTGFRAYWRWKSRPRDGRPKTPLEVRQLIRKISRTLQSTRTRRRREQYIPSVAFCLSQFSADFIIYTCEFEFRQAQDVAWPRTLRANSCTPVSVDIEPVMLWI
jgi:hypothetical protein